MSNPFLANKNKSSGTLLDKIIAQGPQSQKSSVFQPHPPSTNNSTDRNPHLRQNTNENSDINVHNNSATNLNNKPLQSQSRLKRTTSTVIPQNAQLNRHSLGNQKQKQKSDGRELRDNRTSIQKQHNNYTNQRDGDKQVNTKNRQKMVIVKIKSNNGSTIAEMKIQESRILSKKLNIVNATELKISQDYKQSVKNMHGSTAYLNQQLDLCINCTNMNILAQIQRNPNRPLPNNLIKRLKSGTEFYNFDPQRQQLMTKLMQQNLQLGSQMHLIQNIFAICNQYSSISKIDKFISTYICMHYGQFMGKSTGTANNLYNFIMQDRVNLVRLYLRLMGIHRSRLSTLKLIKPQEEMHILKNLVKYFADCYQTNESICKKLNQQLGSQIIFLFSQYLVNSQKFVQLQQFKQHFVPMIVQLRNCITTNPLKQTLNRLIISILMKWGNVLQGEQLGSIQIFMRYYHRPKYSIERTSTYNKDQIIYYMLKLGQTKVYDEKMRDILIFKMCDFVEFHFDYLRKKISNIGNPITDSQAMHIALQAILLIKQYQKCQNIPTTSSLQFSKHMTRQLLKIIYMLNPVCILCLQKYFFIEIVSNSRQIMQQLILPLMCRYYQYQSSNTARPQLVKLSQLNSNLPQGYRLKSTSQYYIILTYMTKMFTEQMGRQIATYMSSSGRSPSTYEFGMPVRQIEELLIRYKVGSHNFETRSRVLEFVRLLVKYVQLYGQQYQYVNINQLNNLSVNQVPVGSARMMNRCREYSADEEQIKMIIEQMHQVMEMIIEYCQQQYATIIKRSTESKQQLQSRKTSKRFPVMLTSSLLIQQMYNSKYPINHNQITNPNMHMSNNSTTQQDYSLLLDYQRALKNIEVVACSIVQSRIIPMNPHQNCLYIRNSSNPSVVSVVNICANELYRRIMDLLYKAHVLLYKHYIHHYIHCNIQQMSSIQQEQSDHDAVQPVVMQMSMSMSKTKQINKNKSSHKNDVIVSDRTVSINSLSESTSKQEMETCINIYAQWQKLANYSPSNPFQNYTIHLHTLHNIIRISDMLTHAPTIPRQLAIYPTLYIPDIPDLHSHRKNSENSINIIETKFDKLNLYNSTMQMLKIINQFTIQHIFGSQFQQYIQLNLIVVSYFLALRKQDAASSSQISKQESKNNVHRNSITKNSTQRDSSKKSKLYSSKQKQSKLLSLIMQRSNWEIIIKTCLNGISLNLRTFLEQTLQTDTKKRVQIKQMGKLIDIHLYKSIAFLELICTILSNLSRCVLDEKETPVFRSPYQLFRNGDIILDDNKKIISNLLSTQIQPLQQHQSYKQSIHKILAYKDKAQNKNTDTHPELCSLINLIFSDKWDQSISRMAGEPQIKNKLEVGLHRIQTMVAELALRHDSIVLAKIVELGYIEKVGGCIIGSLRHYSGSRDRDAHTDWMLRCLNLYYLLFSKCDEIRINADIAQLMTDIITHFLTISKPSRQLEQQNASVKSLIKDIQVIRWISIILPIMHDNLKQGILYLPYLQLVQLVILFLSEPSHPNQNQNQVMCQLQFSIQSSQVLMIYLNNQQSLIRLFTNSYKNNKVEQKHKVAKILLGLLKIVNACFFNFINASVNGKESVSRLVQVCIVCSLKIAQFINIHNLLINNHGSTNPRRTQKISDQNQEQSDQRGQMNIQISKLVTLLKSLENSPMFRATSRDSDNIARFNKTKEIISSVCSLLEFDTYRPHLTYNMQQKNLNAKDSTAQSSLPSFNHFNQALINILMGNKQPFIYFFIAVTRQIIDNRSRNRNTRSSCKSDQILLYKHNKFRCYYLLNYFLTKILEDQTGVFTGYLYDLSSNNRDRVPQFPNNRPTTRNNDKLSLQSSVHEHMRQLVNYITQEKQLSVNMPENAWNLVILLKIIRIKPDILRTGIFCTKVIQFCYRCMQYLSINSTKPHMHPNHKQRQPRNIVPDRQQSDTAQYLDEWVINSQCMQLLCLMYRTHIHCDQVNQSNMHSINRLRKMIFDKVKQNMIRWQDIIKCRQKFTQATSQSGKYDKASFFTSQPYVQSSSTSILSSYILQPTNASNLKPAQNNPNNQHNANNKWSAINYLKIIMTLTQISLMLNYGKLDVLGYVSSFTGHQQMFKIKYVQCIQSILAQFANYYDLYFKQVEASTDQSITNIQNIEKLKSAIQHYAKDPAITNSQSYLNKVLPDYCLYASLLHQPLLCHQTTKQVSLNSSGLSNLGMSIKKTMSISMSMSNRKNTSASLKNSGLSDSISRQLGAVLWYNNIEECLSTMGYQVSNKFCNFNNNNFMTRNTSLANSRRISN